MSPRRRTVTIVPLVTAIVIAAFQYFRADKVTNPETGRSARVAMSGEQEKALGLFPAPAARCAIGIDSAAVAPPQLSACRGEGIALSSRPFSRENASMMTRAFHILPNPFGRAGFPVLL